MISINLYNDTDLLINQESTQILINDILKDYNLTSGEINLVITDDESLREMKNEYFNQNYYTDVIAFNIENNPFEGEIYISHERVKDNAIKYKQTFEKEIKRVIIHGVLHLCGKEDKTNDQKLEMRLLEDSYLKENKFKLID